MNLSQRLLWTLGAAALLGLPSGAIAGPVAFTITGAQFVPGSGYGVDGDENAGNLLDVRFSNSQFNPQSFAFSAPGQSFTFFFGSVDLEEPEARRRRQRVGSGRAGPYHGRDPRRPRVVRRPSPIPASRLEPGL